MIFRGLGRLCLQGLSMGYGRRARSLLTLGYLSMERVVQRWALRNKLTFGFKTRACLLMRQREQSTLLTAKASSQILGRSHANHTRSPICELMGVQTQPIF